jgi:DNA repair exonuclease SbcCD ATPase subunit
LFNRLSLKFFRRHEDLTLHFAQGLVAIRGLNEAGKTTVQEAIAYALFGARALRQPLAECVTWGKADTELRVELDFTFDGVIYTITRKKSGAELNYAGGKVTGQGEVTKFCENLLGTTADTAGKLMLASQGALRGALAGGPTEAAALIENLADFNLIDRVIQLVEHELPSGNTKAQESMVSTLASQLEGLAVGVLDTAADEAAIAGLNAGMGAAYAAQKTTADEVNALKLGAARGEIAAAAAGRRDIEQLSLRIGALEPELTRAIAQPSASVELIQAWRDAQAREEQEDKRWSAHTALWRLQSSELVWGGNRTSLTAEISTHLNDYNRLSNARNALLVRRGAVIAGLIKEQTCAFCDKDLAAVPEVVQRNIAVNAEVAAIDIDILAHETGAAAAKASYDELALLDREALAYEAKLTRYSDYITIDYSQVPARWAWVGDTPVAGAERPNYAEDIRRGEAEIAACQRAIAAKEANVAQHAQLTAQRIALDSAQQGLEAAEALAKARLASGDVLEAHVRALGDEVTRTRAALDAARVALEHKVALHSLATQQRAGVQGQLDQARATLEDMNFSNALIKKLRSAKPVISDKLWSIVLAAVSGYFSTIRGVQSVITRSDNSFKADGQPVAGLSGSTLDALGLAIRIALTKTFLPNARFLMLDEPGAACDDERETNMLGLVAASDFDQVLLVTHSDLADAFAAQVVEL